MTAEVAMSALTEGRHRKSPANSSDHLDTGRIITFPSGTGGPSVADCGSPPPCTRNHVRFALLKKVASAMYSPDGKLGKWVDQRSLSSPSPTSIAHKPFVRVSGRFPET